MESSDPPRCAKHSKQKQAAGGPIVPVAATQLPDDAPAGVEGRLTPPEDADAPADSPAADPGIAAPATSAPCFACSLCAFSSTSRAGLSMRERRTRGKHSGLAS
eukprot:5223608-Amphidinium_carterae.1